LRHDTVVFLVAGSRVLDGDEVQLLREAVLQDERDAGVLGHQQHPTLTASKIASKIASRVWTREAVRLQDQLLRVRIDRSAAPAADAGYWRKDASLDPLLGAGSSVLPEH
jgi:hypothetical protein